MKYLSLLLFVLALSFTSCSTIETVEEQEELFESTSFVTMNADEEALFNTINDYRVSMGMNALQFNQTAYQVAQNHNAYMINKNRISHENFQNRAQELNQKANAVSVGENVAKNFPTNEGVLEAWLNSKSHREAIEGDFTHTGISITINPAGEPYFTQMFFSK